MNFYGTLVPSLFLRLAPTASPEFRHRVDRRSDAGSGFIVMFNCYHYFSTRMPFFQVADCFRDLA